MADFDLSQFSTSFFNEVHERLSSMHQALMKLKSGDVSNDNMLSLQRDAHTIKGSALMLGSSDIGETAQIFENMVEELIQHPTWRHIPSTIQFLYKIHHALDERLKHSDDQQLIHIQALSIDQQQLLADLNDGSPLNQTISQSASLNMDHHALPDSPSKTSQHIAASYRPDTKDIDAQKTTQASRANHFVRVDAERLEKLSNQVIELNTQYAHNKAFEAQFNQLSKDFLSLQQDFQQFLTASSQLHTDDMKQCLNKLDINFEQQAQQQRSFIEDIQFSSIRHEYMMRDLRDQVLSLMLRPLDSISSTLSHAVRDIAMRYNKRVHFIMNGRTLEMNQGVIESLTEPLCHLLHYAIQHSIEKPEERLAIGKNEEAQISIIAEQHGHHIHIEIIDNGRGLNAEFIKKTAISKKLISQMKADNMHSSEILDMIFRSKFNTHDSEHDMNMNDVQTAIHRLRGSIHIQSDVGHGTKFTLSIPTSTSVQFALMFRIEGIRFGILTHMVEQAISYHDELIQHDHEGQAFIIHEASHVPLVNLPHILGYTHHVQHKNKNIIIAEHIEGYIGIIVDELLDEIEIVVQDLDPYIQRYNPQGIIGNAIVPDGSVVMLLEPYGIKEMKRKSLDLPRDIQSEDNKAIQI